MKRILALLLAVVFCLSLTSCSGGDNEESASMSDKPSSSGSLPAEERPVHDNIKNREEDIKKAKSKNKDVIGWLYVPGMKDLDQAVVQDVNEYSYEYRDPEGKYLNSSEGSEYWIYGAYFTHKRNTFGDSSRLSRNTVIFGHSDLGHNNKNTADDPNGPCFSQLFQLTEEASAKKTPYVYFSTPEEDMVFEIFSVMYNDSGLWYIDPKPANNKFDDFLATARARSLYNYDVEVTPDDKIITLSTCTLKYGWNQKGNYRYVVMAKLINPEDATKKEAAFSVNPSPQEPTKAPY